MSTFTSLLMVELSLSLFKCRTRFGLSSATTKSCFGLPQFCPCQPIGIPRLPGGCFDQSSTTTRSDWAPAIDTARASKTARAIPASEGRQNVHARPKPTTLSTSASLRFIGLLNTQLPPWLRDDRALAARVGPRRDRAPTAVVPADALAVRRRRGVIESSESSDCQRPGQTLNVAGVANRSGSADHG